MVFVYVITLKSLHKILLELGWALNPVTGVLKRERRERFEAEKKLM